MPFDGPFLVIRDHMGERRWSRDFETLDEAGQCFDRVTRAIGRPEHVDGRYSFWYEYGAHGERVQLVHSAQHFRAEMKRADEFGAIDLMRKYGVIVDATGEFLRHVTTPHPHEDGYDAGMYAGDAGVDTDTVEEEEREADGHADQEYIEDQGGGRRGVDQM